MTAGRSCPLHYRYGAEALAAPSAWSAETVYVIGGLYGNTQALEAIRALAAAEPVTPKLVFNGDFHWFDVDPVQFQTIDAGVRVHTPLRGNVETELAADSDDAGCGCGYPDWVPDKVVQRSNQILQRLKATAECFPIARERLRKLPMHLTIQVGPLRVGIVHGDADALAGWGFARETVNRPEHQAQLDAWFTAANVRVFASSHTCLPVVKSRPGGVIVNNGAAGMPNAPGQHHGLITRLSVHPSPHAAEHSTQIANVRIATLPVRYDHLAFRRSFLAQWPSGSPAHLSYFERIDRGAGTG